MKKTTAALALIPIAIGAPTGLVRRPSHYRTDSSCLPVTVIFANDMSPQIDTAVPSIPSVRQDPSGLVVQGATFNTRSTRWDISSGFLAAESAADVKDLIARAQEQCPNTEVVVLGYARSGKDRESGMTGSQASFINSLAVSASRLAAQRSGRSGGLFDD